MIQTFSDAITRTIFLTPAEFEGQSVTLEDEGNTAGQCSHPGVDRIFDEYGQRTGFIMCCRCGATGDEPGFACSA